MQHQSQTDGATSNKVCDRSDVRSTELLPVGPPTDLDVSETANVISDSEMALFTDVVKRGKGKMKARAFAPPAVAVVRKTGKSSAITGRGVGVGIQAAKRSGRLASVFASRLAPDLTDAGLKSYLDSELGLSVNVGCVKATDWHTSFHITCRCENTAVFMNDIIWPEGAYVRWWGEKRRGSNGSAHSDLPSDGMVMQTVTMTDAQPIIDI